MGSLLTSGKASQRNCNGQLEEYKKPSHKEGGDASTISSFNEKEDVDIEEDLQASRQSSPAQSPATEESDG